jgi:hypothetical protein
MERGRWTFTPIRGYSISEIQLCNQREAEHIVPSILKHILLMGWCSRLWKDFSPQIQNTNPASALDEHCNQKKSGLAEVLRRNVDANDQPWLVGDGIGNVRFNEYASDKKERKQQSFSLSSASEAISKLDSREPFRLT